MAKLSGKTLQSLIIIQTNKRLSFSQDDTSSYEQWVIVLKQESDTVQIEALMLTFKLSKRESEVLYWAFKGKISLDISDIFSSSPRTIKKFRTFF